MYRKFYALTRKPFEMSPDPFFYFPTQRHNEALALLTYGVQDKKGFVVVSGEVGTGKTLLVRCLLDALNRHKIAFAFVYNPVLSVPEFLAHLLNEFGIPSKSNSKIELLSSLNNYLLARCRRGETTALVVDEAQLLSWELLEEIRLLTNLETSQFKLLQIVLVGQPELEEKLDSQELRQLKQRVAMRCRLKPLDLEEVRGYIQRRLGLAGADSRAATIFPEEAIQAVHQYSRGIPRLINTICENALISGYSKQAEQVTPAIVQEVAIDLRLEASPSSPISKSDNAEQLWEVLAQMIKQWDESPKKSTQDFKPESGAQTG
jgi:type II secretory pathway predicted ATPase ExeA